MRLTVSRFSTLIPQSIGQFIKIMSWLSTNGRSTLTVAFACKTYVLRDYYKKHMQHSGYYIRAHFHLDLTCELNFTKKKMGVFVGLITTMCVYSHTVACLWCFSSRKQMITKTIPIKWRASFANDLGIYAYRWLGVFHLIICIFPIYRIKVRFVVTCWSSWFVIIACNSCTSLTYPRYHSYSASIAVSVK